MLEFKGRNAVYKIFMGNDKYENELLIKWGWPEDVWFHVDEYSSAHVYVRLPQGQTIKDIPKEVLEDCAQLTKGNSTEGCKKPAVDIIYTPWTNLRKDQDTMDVGTIGFKDQRQVIKIRNVSKNAELLKKLEKSREQRACDFERERMMRDKEELQKAKAERKAAVVKRQQEEAAEREAYIQKHYLDLPRQQPETNEPRGDGTIEACREMEEDFM